MAALPADPLFGGHLREDPDRAGIASVDHKGVRHVLVPPSGGGIYALDMERKDAVLEPETAALLRHIDPDAPPLLTWTRLEVIAKLTDQPMHLVLRSAQAQCAGADISIRHPPHPTHWVSVGRRWG